MYMIPFLEAEKANAVPSGNRPMRVALIHFYLDKPVDLREVKVHLARKTLASPRLLAGSQSYTDAEEMKRSEKACLADPKIQQALKDMDLPEGAEVVIEPWTYSPDGMNDMSRRIIMVTSPVGTADT
jgi:primary-amine oxidase